MTRLTLPSSSEPLSRVSTSRQLVVVLDDAPGQRVEQFTPTVRAECRPGREGVVGGVDGRIDVSGGTGRDIGEATAVDR